MAQTIIKIMGVHEGKRAYFLRTPSEILSEIYFDKFVVSIALR